MKLFSFLKILKKKPVFNTPRSYRAEILRHLILNGEVSLLNFPYLSSLRTRMSEFSLEDKLLIEKGTIERTSKFGNPFTITVYSLAEESRDSAIELYNKINPAI